MNNAEKKREIVLPGELIGEGLRLGAGVYNEGKQVYASVFGIKSIRGDYANVIPLSGRYIPKIHDCIIGIITEAGPSSWLVDINSPYPALLHVSESPWRVNFGETEKFLCIRDTVLIKVSGVDEIKHINVTMKDIGLMKLTGGQIINVSPSRVPRIVGRAGSMISLIKRKTNCKIFVGQNGRIWIDGKPDMVKKAIGAIGKIEKEAHTFGLTDAISKYLDGKG